MFNIKYVNAVPLNCLSEEFLRNYADISRQDMFGWMIRLHEYYLKPVHMKMRDEVMQLRSVHCDENPFVMPKNGKEYMCVFHSPDGHDLYVSSFSLHYILSGG